MSKLREFLKSANQDEKSPARIVYERLIDAAIFIVLYSISLIVIGLMARYGWWILEFGFNLVDYVF